MGVQSHQHAEREKDIQRYLQRMERVLSQAERMHFSTHVQPARNRHSLSGSQDSLKHLSITALDEDLHAEPPSAPSGGTENASTSQQQPLLMKPSSQAQEAGAVRDSSTVSGQNYGQAGRPGRHSEEGGGSMAPGCLFRQEDGQGAGVLDTSATLSDWIMRSTSSSAGASPLQTGETAEAEAQCDSAAADVSGDLELMASLSEWAHINEAARPQTGPVQRARSPISYPVALSDASMSFATSSPGKLGRAGSRAGPRASASGAPHSACCTSDTEDTADSGSPQGRLQSSADSAQRGPSASSPQGGLSSQPWHACRPAKSGGSSVSAAAAAAGRPERSLSPQKSGRGTRTSHSTHTEQPQASWELARSLEQSGDSSGSGGQLEAVPAANGTGTDLSRQEPSPREGQQQVPALAKLKLRLRTRQRASLQGSLQGLRLSHSGEAPEPAPALAKTETAKGDTALSNGRDDRATSEQEAGSAADAGASVDKQLVFKASRQLPRSPVRGSPGPSGQADWTQSALTPPSPATAKGATECAQDADTPAQDEEPQNSESCCGTAGSPVLKPDQPAAAPDSALQCRDAEPDVAAGQYEPKCSPSCSVFAVNTVLLPAESHPQQSIEAHADVIFSPAHVLPRSPLRRKKIGPSPFKATPGGEAGTCTSPQQPDSTFPIQPVAFPTPPAMEATPKGDNGPHASIPGPDRAHVAKQRSPTVPASPLETREERIAMPRLPLGHDVHALHATHEAPCRGSPRHAGAAPSRLPRPPSAASPRPATSRPSSGGATKLPSPPVALPAAQASPRPVIKASAFLSAQALAQADQLLSSCFAKAPTPGLFPRRQRTSGQEDLKDAAAPSYRAAESQRKQSPERTGSSARGTGDRPTSRSPPAPRGYSQAHEERQSQSGTRTVREGSQSSASPATRSTTSPGAPSAGDRRLSGRLSAKQAPSRSPPEKAAMKQRLSLGAPQRIRSPAQQASDLASSSGVIKPAPMRPKEAAPSPMRLKAQTPRLSEPAAAEESGSKQGRHSSPRKRSQAKPLSAPGRDTILSAVSKLPIDVLTSGMHGSMLD